MLSQHLLTSGEAEINLKNWLESEKLERLHPSFEEDGLTVEEFIQMFDNEYDLNNFISQYCKKLNLNIQLHINRAKKCINKYRKQKGLQPLICKYSLKKQF